jgi:hypothetical protein
MNWTSLRGKPALAATSTSSLSMSQQCYYTVCKPFLQAFFYFFSKKDNGFKQFWHTVYVNFAQKVTATTV